MNSVYILLLACHSGSSMLDIHCDYCVGEAGRLPVLHWSCVASVDIDDVDDVAMTTSSCPSDCHTHTDCGTCTSAGALCVWSERLNQVCAHVLCIGLSVSKSVRLHMCLLLTCLSALKPAQVLTRHATEGDVL